VSAVPAARRRATGELVPTAELVAWLHAQLRDPRRALAPHAALARDLGISEKKLRRWLRSEDSDGNPVDTFVRATVEDALDHADVPFCEIYPHLDNDEVEKMSDRFCSSCRDMVTGGADLICPWCETATGEGPAKPKAWCPRCDRMVYPTAHNDHGSGDCWRCGTATKPMPYDPCACGCDQRRPRFDPYGRRARYVRGHAPRSPENAGDVDLEPFAVWLERELRTLDPKEALARRTGLSREDVLATLERRDDRIAREKVRRALWIAARGGTGKGLPPRIGALGFFDLYPNERRSRTCPGCGAGKAPHAELCKQCRRRRNRTQATKPPRTAPRLTAGVLLDAKRLYDREQLAFLAIVERLLDRTPTRAPQRSRTPSAANSAHAAGRPATPPVPRPPAEIVRSRPKDNNDPGAQP
jgi:hypothetical protein